MFARPFLDTLDFVRQGKELRGVVAVSELSRMREMLADSSGDIAYVVRGYQARDGASMLELSVEGTVRLRCQRCLEAMDFPIGIATRLKVAEGEFDEFAEDDDEVDAIPASRQLDVIGLVEDEVLLALPFAPRHKEGACQAVGFERQAEASPFAVLAKLKNVQD